MEESDAAKVLQKMYSRFLDTLDAKSINGYVFGAELISREVKQQISNAATTKDGNEILLDHLYDTATKESLEEFASIVSGDKVSKKVQQLGKELQQKLRQLKEGSSVTTKADEPQHSDKNEELDESSSDSEQQLSFESSNDESESEQEEVSNSDSDSVPESHRQADTEATPYSAKLKLPKKTGTRKLFKTPDAKRPRIIDSDNSESDQESEDQDVGKTLKKPWSGEAKEVLRELMDQPCAKPFVEPVDLDKYSDYKDYVAHPLCLKDMERKLQKGKYQTSCDFFDDFKRIVANSRLYNTDKSSEIVKCTKAFAMEVKRKEKMFQLATAHLPRQLRSQK